MGVRIMRYDTCQRADGDCSVCSLNNYSRDCNNNPINNLAYQRTLAGISQQKLADLSGVSKRTIEKYEQGENDINNARVNIVYRLATALSCSIEDILNHPL